MPSPSTSHLPPPKDWDEFEQICADLFSKEWSDRNTTRYGRQGQRQNGVDIYGCPADVGYAGVQCKGRHTWPPRPLTTNDIGNEVSEAKNFKPPLAEFTIATIAPDDAKLQDHVRAITERHKLDGLFAVYVIGWGEIIRRLSQYQDLIEKHYGFASLSSLRQDINAVPEKVIEHLQKAGVTIPLVEDVSSQTTRVSINAIPTGLAAALERDLAHRYSHALRRALFPEVGKVDEFQLLAKEVLEGNSSSVSEALRRKIFLRAARSTAVRGWVDEAEKFLAAASALQGDDGDLSARARLLESHGRIDEAIQLLRDATDADARSTLLSILLRHRGHVKALEWFAERSFSVSDLTANGVHTLVMLHLEQENIERTRDVLMEATEAQLSEAPSFLFLRAALRLAVLFPKPDQWLPLRGFPIDVRSGHTIHADSVVASELDAAIADLNQLLPLSSELGLRDTRRTAEAFLTWCNLLHPTRRDAALAQLRADMTNPATALPRLQFAFVHIPHFDPTPIARYLESRQQLGGLNEEELRAALVIRLHGEDPRETADFIAQFRPSLDTAFGREGIASIEIQALAMAGDATSARLALKQHRGLLHSNLIRLLETEVAKAEGSDPIVEHKRAYESTKSPQALRALVAELLRHKDHRAVAFYAEELYAQTNDPGDAVVAANALANIGDVANFLRVIDAYPFVKEHNPLLARHHAWRLFELGRIADAKAIANQLRTGHDSKFRDLNLEIAIAVESGDWESLSGPLNAFLDQAERYDGQALIRAARLAQASGQGPCTALMDAAVAHSPDDPAVLIGAYSMILEGEWRTENQRQRTGFDGPSTYQVRTDPSSALN